LATAQSGDTFGDMNLVYRQDIGRNSDDGEQKRQTLVAKNDVKLLRLKQEDYLGIVQYQAKLEDINKREMLTKLPFMNKLLRARDVGPNSEKGTADPIDRIVSVMKPLYFSKGDQLYDEDDDTLYLIKEGNVMLTSVKAQEFVLGPGDYIGRQALMGSRGKEPEVKSLQALSSGMAYIIPKSVAEKVLGANYVDRQTSRLDDLHKLDNFQCIKSINLDPKTLSVLAESVDDKTFAPGSIIMKQGAQIEPCLYLIREGTVTLSSDDGAFVREVGPGGYFGVEKLLIPKDVTGNKAKPSKDMKLPAQWNVKVNNRPCIAGVLSLLDSQEILDNDGKKKEKLLVTKPESQMIVKRKQTSKIVRSTVDLDDLEMVSVLGEGAFGKVWLVQTEVNGKKEEFALKKVDKENDLIDALDREIKFLSSFGFHPFIVHLIKVFNSDDSKYMLMNFASGGELWDIVHREDADGNWSSGIPEVQARFYTFLLADTLAYVHSKKYVYRDLKMENVLIDSDGYPVLIDFGFCKFCPDKTVSMDRPIERRMTYFSSCFFPSLAPQYTCCGTPNYVAPEIITNDGHNQAVDWWALGVLLYEMVSGEHPFYADGMDQIAVFESIALEDYAPMTADCNQGVLDLIDGFLVKDPAQRLGSLAGREKDIINHPYFSGLDLPNLRSRKVKAPWVPHARS
jgi:CRP-like cAMP-binding protein